MKKLVLALIVASFAQNLFAEIAYDNVPVAYVQINNVTIENQVDKMRECELELKSIEDRVNKYWYALKVEKCQLKSSGSQPGSYEFIQAKIQFIK